MSETATQFEDTGFTPDNLPDHTLGVHEADRPSLEDARPFKRQSLSDDRTSNGSPCSW